MAAKDRLYCTGKLEMGTFTNRKTTEKMLPSNKNTIDIPLLVLIITSSKYKQQETLDRNGLLFKKGGGNSQCTQVMLHLGFSL